MKFATGRGLKEIHWKQQEVQGWPEFLDWLDLGSPAGRKECGGYVCGTLQETRGHAGDSDCVGLHRNKRAVVGREVLTLDADSAGVGFSADVRLELDGALAMHTTWSHTPEAPRWRLLIPLDREVGPAEYRLLVSAVMECLGAEQFDAGSKEPERFMHRPSCKDRSAYEWVVEPGAPLDVDTWLEKAEEMGLEEDPVWDRKFHIDDSPLRPKEDGLHPACVELLEIEGEKLAMLQRPWATGAGWDLGVFKTCCVVWELVNSGWSGLDADAGLAWVLAHAPVDDVWDDYDNTQKWLSAMDRVAGGGIPMPTGAYEDFIGMVVYPEIPLHFNDAYLTEWMAHKGLEDEWCWNGGLGWMQWSGRKWVSRTEDACVEAVRQAVSRLVRKAAVQRDANLLKAVTGMLSTRSLRAVVALMRGHLEKLDHEFDAHPDLLNVGNGVVDLRTGELKEHNKELLLTRITTVDYRVGARSADWDTVLGCLEPEVMDWMQVRFGQAATGWPTSDDVLPIGQGGGSNGKSTLLAGLFGALGEHMVLIPEKLLRGGAGDHPTELMTLLGARVAVIDETPEVAQLSVPRLKAVLGQSRMVARAVFKNNVSWVPTHSLFLMSNYIPQVRETDLGTWRRLALVRFERTYARDDAFRSRVTGGSPEVREAALAWVVEGARRWYEAGEKLPDLPMKVALDTMGWRVESDLVMGFFNDRLEADRDSCVLATELLAEMNTWLRERGHAGWSYNTLTSRMGGHEEIVRLGVERRQVRSPQNLSVRDPFVAQADRPVIWVGLRWKPSSENVNG